jgi:kynureninase
MTAIGSNLARDFRADESFARDMDATDPLRRFREHFLIPKTKSGADIVYLAGNSLGLQPRDVSTLLNEELEDWATLAVEAHFRGRRPWYSYHEIFRAPGAAIVGGASGGASGGEVVMMNSLTVNLHLMLVSFYQPTKSCYKVLLDWPQFPSDLYALETHIRARGFDSREAMVFVKPAPGKHVITMEQLEEALDTHGDEIALVLFSGVNYFTGQLFDIESITAAAHAHGCVAGFDLAHAVGNIELKLHDWGVDFAVWCSYKYLNSGPGAVAGCFVHTRHGDSPNLQRYAGWWGNDPDTRFRMHLNERFIPQRGAEGWQVSNPPIFSLAPLKASLDLFMEATMPALRKKSLALTGYLRSLLEELSVPVEIVTPREPAAHGCQLSLMIKGDLKQTVRALEAAGVVCDAREPNVIRAAPVPLYNTFHDCWVLAQTLAKVLK